MPIQQSIKTTNTKPMKKLLTLAALLGATSLSFGQGQVTFANSSSTLVTLSSNSVSLGSALASSTGNRYYYTLLFTADTSVTSLSGVADPRWTWSGDFAANSAAGRLSGGTAVFAGTTQGGLYNIVCIGWDAAGGAAPTQQALETYLATGAAGTGSGWFGVSQVAQDVQIGGGGFSTPGIFGTGTSAAIPGFALNYFVVPEPASMAIAGLGAAALLIFRRRK
jgi:hypothetical protein